MAGLFRLAFRVLLLSIYTLGLTWSCRAVLDGWFDLHLQNAFWIRDFLGNLVIALLCFMLVQTLGKALILSGVIIMGFQLANGGKLAVLGTPVSPDDFMNVQNLFYLTDGWRRVLLYLVAALPLIAACLLIPFKKMSAWAMMLLVSGCAIASNHYSEPLRHQLDKQFGNSVWNQPENFKRRGLALHIAQESLRTMAKVGKYPNESTVNAAVDDLSAPAAKPAKSNEHLSGKAGNFTKRNVHIIVLESFYDPMSLGPEWVPDDPFPPSFRTLWNQTNQSTALSPVFGGYTANAEFETLCGFPVTENAVFFEGWLRKKVPCLPAVLADAGYKSIASHPNVPGFWNRSHAYQLVGFDQYLSKADFNMSDSVGGLLLDHSYYDQVFEHINSDTEAQPLFNYMLTYHGHLPFPTNQQYPDKIKAGQEAPLLHGYLNQLWYKSRDLMSRLDALRLADPDAIIVAFGDHLPFLGPNYGVYTEALSLPDNRSEFTGDMLEYLISTPLIVIDGKRGPVSVGKLPLYRLPELILELLGKNPQQSMFNWAENPENTVIRPVYGMHISLTDGATTACPDDNTAASNCTASAHWLSRTRVLINDIFTGKQYSLRQLMPLTGS